MDLRERKDRVQRACRVRDLQHCRCMSQAPRDPAFDSTLGLLKDGYAYLWKRHQRLGSDVFVTRLAGRTTVCIHGPEAARLFYDDGKFQRHGALPRRVVTSLFGKKAIHTLDDAAHRARKQVFLSLMGPSKLDELMLRTAQEWRAAVQRWERMDSVNLFDAAQAILTRSVCDWAGVPLSAHEVPVRGRQLGWMVDAFGGAGPRLWRGKLARMQAERWMQTMIRDVRRGALTPAADSALHVMAQLSDIDGTPVAEHTAAVELLNVVRPTAAIAWYIVFAALALHQYPEARARLASEAVPGEYADWFTQEVRRLYPFTPYLGAKVRSAFTWQGHRFEPGTRVLLDVYGANHDPRIWSAPDEFRPERFAQWQGSAYDFIPQGGGDVRTGHRCPGEWITMHNMTLAQHFLTRCMRYEVVAGQDLSFDLGRMPTRPRSGFLIHNVRATPELDADVPVRPSLSAARGNELVRNRQAEPLPMQH
jgi:fatty-acid peroxygenase